jgi:hypothetical protein
MYTVTAPLVLAKDEEGHTHHVYQGGIIEWLSDEQAAHFLTEGLVEKTGTSDDDGKPAKAAPKADWVEHAVADGYDRDEVEAMTKADLVALFD